jgi:hypothetical protein
MPCWGFQGLSMPLGIRPRIAVPEALPSRSVRPGREPSPNSLQTRVRQASRAFVDQEALDDPGVVQVHRVAVAIGQPPDLG